MSAMTLKVPVAMACDCCGAELEGTWELPASALLARRKPKADERAASLAKAARESGWLVRGSAALCPSCLQDALADGPSPLPPPSSVAQAVDQLALAREIRKLRREVAGDDPGPRR